MLVRAAYEHEQHKFHHRTKRYMIGYTLYHQKSGVSREMVEDGWAHDN